MRKISSYNVKVDLPLTLLDSHICYKELTLRTIVYIWKKSWGMLIWDRRVPFFVQRLHNMSSILLPQIKFLI